MDQKVERIKLVGQEAIDLWLKGKEAWNQWVNENPDADVDFSGVDFSKLRHISITDAPSLINFPTYIYDWDVYRDFIDSVIYGPINRKPNNGLDLSRLKYFPIVIDFRGFIFPKGKVDFNGASFGHGDVTFFDADFGEGNVYFDRARFGNGTLDFSKTTFGRGKVSFYDAFFGVGNTLFRSVEFGDGDISFSSTTFGQGHASFSGSVFGGGEVSFSHAKFRMTNSDFSGVNFGEGSVSFEGALYLKGAVDFQNTRFGSEGVSFRRVEFNTCSVSFAKSSFEGRVIFAPKSLFQCNKISFNGSSFKSELVLTGFSSNVPIDLCHTNLSHPLDLDEVTMSFQSQPYLRVFQKSIDKKDTSRFRRLKKIAKESDNQKLSIDMFAQEMRASYWHTLKGAKLALYYLYDWSSDYGRSLMRPFLGLFMFWGLFCSLYWITRTQSEVSPWSAWLMSLGHSIPIYSGAKDARSDAIHALYGSTSNIPDMVHALTITQGIISGLLLFLIALALRNLFRS